MIKTDDLVFLTDLYEYSMAYTYFKQKRHEDIVYFDMFTRKIPDKGGYLIFNGLRKLIESIQNFKFNQSHIDYLRECGFDDEDFLDYLLKMDLRIDMWAVEDGTVVFANEPLVTVRGTVIEAQIIETLLLLSIKRRVAYPSRISLTNAIFVIEK